MLRLDGCPAGNCVATFLIPIPNILFFSFSAYCKTSPVARFITLISLLTINHHTRVHMQLIHVAFDLGDESDVRIQKNNAALLVEQLDSMDDPLNMLDDSSTAYENTSTWCVLCGETPVPTH